MNADDFQKYLKDRYYHQVNWYDVKAARNQRQYKRFQWGLIIFSALTPVMITLDWSLPYQTVLRWVPLVTSVFVAIMTAALKTFGYQENWINYRTTCETLKKEIQFYEAGISDYSSVNDKEALFVERVENLISRENTLWLSSRKEQVKKQDTAYGK